MAEAIDLTGKTAVVTGAGRGLGLAYATALAAAGAAVVVNDVDEAAAAEAVRSVRDVGGRAVAVVGPVGPTDTAQRLVATAFDEFDGLDVLVTNAGVLRDSVLWKMSDEDFDTVLDVHVRGTFTCVRAAAIAMRAQGRGGRVIVAGSPTGQRGTFGQTNYAAAKAAIVGMMRTWALELARAEITVNALVPVAATAMTKTIPFFAPHVEAYERDGVPLPEALRKGEGFGTVEDVAGLVVYLASDAARDVNGQAIGIGGDRLALWSHPRETATAYTDGGWTSDAIATAWPSTLGRVPESVGIPAPRPLDEPVRSEAAAR
ncbi:SDR family NAD(P)-dependent oxidoreductase [Catenulispora rubra]|uniref:SDR family NAD(P)-dependent oxidoreductase n=1 Tax=Catenulispora rubra TaxID=280293 RepID=UPI002B27B43A|nr:SDR family NAD(P)-dependent oxidoreductase [Catenulispora rubra]